VRVNDIGTPSSDQPAERPSGADVRSHVDRPTQRWNHRHAGRRSDPALSRVFDPGDELTREPVLRESLGERDRLAGRTADVQPR